MRNIKIASVNVRGLGGQEKRRDVMHHLRNMNFDIIFLQDTHLTERKVQFLNSLWRGRTYHSCFTNISRGTSILIDKGLQHTMLFEFICGKGNYVIIGCKIGLDTYVFGCIYGPNKDEPEFYREINEKLDSVECDHIILGGDLNFVMNYQTDCYGYVRENNINARNAFITMCNQHRIIDIWRCYNPDRHEFTWAKSNPNKGARLDMFFISEHLRSLCVDQKILPGYRTDHNIITIEIKSSDASRGPGLWKFNESLLSNEDYLVEVQKCIEATVKQYALSVYSSEFLTNEYNYKDIKFQIDEDLFYETLLMMIRGETVKFAKQKAKREKEKERKLLIKIEKAQAEYFKSKTENSAALLEQYKEQLENMRKPLIKGLIVRSRTMWHEEGERSSKYFLGLEKRNALRKSVGVIKVGEQILTTTSSILETFTANLASKYSRQHNMQSDTDEFISGNVTVTLSDQERDAIDFPITYEELTDAIRKMKSGKSPGSNGYTSSFFKHFWNVLGHFLHRAYVFCSEKNKMISSHREGIITMIPKAGQSPDHVKAWRPITLLNTDFKIISSAIAARLQRVISKVTDSCQTAYVKGRYIGENTRLVYDVIHKLSEEGKIGAIISADFESAFDSLSWEFVSRVLKYYNFGSYFRKMLTNTYMNDENFSRILLNGFLGEKIYLRCGIRQGDPVSGYLFNLAVNVLANQIKQSRIISGIQLSPNSEVKIMQYADDTVLFLDGEASSIRGALSELETYSNYSGLRLNIEKTACLPIGVDPRRYNSENFGCKWVSQIKILGITFSNNNKEITETNLEPKIVQINKEIAQWRRRNLTQLGKITVIKSLLLSKLVHLLTVLPNPSQSVLKQLERIFFSFLWHGGRDPIKRAKTIQSYAAGGLQMIDVKAFVQSLKLTWLKRLRESKAPWVILAENELPCVENIPQFGSKKLLRVRSKINNPFWQDVLEAYSRFSIDFKPDDIGILNESLWFSDHSKFSCTVVKNWNEKGLRFIADLIDEQTGRIMTREAVQDRFGIRMTILCYSSLVRSLPECVKHQSFDAIPKPIMPTRLNFILNHRKFSRYAYQTATQSRKAEIKNANERLKHKWMTDIGHFTADSTVTVMKATHSTRLIMLHYKIVNRFLTTNKFLNIIHVKDEDKCTFCHGHAETLVHMFWFCTKVQFFLTNVKLFLQSTYHFTIQITPEIMFFVQNINPIEVLIVTLMKQVICEARSRESIPNVANFKYKLKREAENEIIAARNANKMRMFESKWGTLENILQHE